MNSIDSHAQSLSFSLEPQTLETMSQIASSYLSDQDTESTNQPLRLFIQKTLASQNQNRGLRSLLRKYLLLAPDPSNKYITAYQHAIDFHKLIQDAALIVHEEADRISIKLLDLAYSSVGHKGVEEPGLPDNSIQNQDTTINKNLNETRTLNVFYSTTNTLDGN